MQNPKLQQSIKDLNNYLQTCQGFVTLLVKKDGNWQIVGTVTEVENKEQGVMLEEITKAIVNMTAGEQIYKVGKPGNWKPNKKTT